MDVFYDMPTDLPKHQTIPLEAHPVRVITTWQLGTFVENLVILGNGEIVVSLHSEHRLERIDLNGTHHVVAQLPAPPTSLIESGDDLFAFGGAPGQSPGYLWHVKANGEIETRATSPEVLFLNGSTPFLPGTALVVDSLLGKIFQVDLTDGTFTTWFAHEWLTKSHPFPLMPGGNGLRIFNRHLYISNTDRAILVRVPIQADGTPGAIELVAEHLRADDFAFDTDGVAYLTTHVENSLVRLSPSGERIAIAGAEQEMPGCTAVRFGRTPETEHTLFVTTTGGLIGPYQGVAKDAKLVAIEVNATGYPINFLETV